MWTKGSGVSTFRMRCTFSLIVKRCLLEPLIQLLNVKTYWAKKEAASDDEKNICNIIVMLIIQMLVHCIINCVSVVFKDEQNKDLQKPTVNKSLIVINHPFMSNMTWVTTNYSLIVFIPMNSPHVFAPTVCGDLTHLHHLCTFLRLRNKIEINGDRRVRKTEDQRRKRFHVLGLFWNSPSYYFWVRLYHFLSQ